MSPPDVDDMWRSVRDAAPEVMDRDECRAMLADVRRVRSWIAGAELRATRRLKELNVAGRAESAEAALENDGGLSGRDARDTSDRERAAGELPGFEDALDIGEVSAGHLDVLARVLGRLSDLIRTDFKDCEADLLAHAASESVDAFARRCRRLVKALIVARQVDDDVDDLEVRRRAVKVRRWVDDVTGMHHSHLELDPLRDAAFWTAVNGLLDKMRARTQDAGGTVTSFNQLQADALIEAVNANSSGSGDGSGAGNSSGFGAGGGFGRRVPEIVVLIDWAVLVGDAAAVGICETVDATPLPVATVRQMACDAEVYPVVLGGDGQVLDKGRSVRTATAAQRAGLAAMHATCGHPDCRVGFSSTRMHHVAHWIRDHGATDIDNLLPLCETHHHLVHEGGWTLTMTSDRVATWTLPDGTIYHRGSTIDRHGHQTAA